MNMYRYGYVNDSFCLNSVLQHQVSTPCLLAQWSLTLQLRHHAPYTRFFPHFMCSVIFLFQVQGLIFNYDSPSPFLTLNKTIIYYFMYV